MKLQLFVLGFLICVFSSFSAAPQIILNSVEPNPVQPGQDLTLQIKITNSGNDEIILDKTTLNFGESFILKSDDQTNSQTRLCTSCSKTITFFLTAKSSLESGFYTIKSNTRYDSTLSVEQDFSVQVMGLPNLVLNVANDIDVIPEDTFNLSLELTNEGTGLAKNIKITPSSDDIGLLDENFLFLRDSFVGSKQMITGEFLSSSLIESGYLLLPILLTYEDAQNNEYVVEETIGIEVKDRAHVILQHLQTDSNIVAGESTEISIRLENDGVGRAKNVRVVLDGPLSGQKEAFFGSLDKREDLPFIFSLVPQDSGSLPVELSIYYTDDFGDHLTKQDFVLEVESRSYLLFFMFVFIIVGVLLLVLFKRR